MPKFFNKLTANKTIRKALPAIPGLAITTSVGAHSLYYFATTPLNAVPKSMIYYPGFGAGPRFEPADKIQPNDEALPEESLPAPK